MKDEIIVKRYADAFLAYAKVAAGLKRAISDLKNFKTVIRDNPEFEEFLFSPEIPYQEKCRIIDAVLNKDFLEETGQFLKLLIEKGRIEYITEICDYVRTTYSHGQTVEAVLTSTYPLDLGVLEELKTKLEEKLKVKLNLYLNLDTDLLGGVKVRVGNIIIDGSVRRRLNDLKKKLMTVQVNPALSGAGYR